MRFLARWEVPPEKLDSVLRRFTTAGAPPPGVRVLGRWHFVDGSGGIMIVEAESMKPLTDFSYEWNDLLFLQIAPVVEDGELMAVIAKRKPAETK